MFNVHAMPPRELADRLIDQWDFGGRTANPWERLTHFIQCALAERMAMSDAAVVLDADGRVHWACMALRNPGRTSLLVNAPPPPATQVQPALVQALRLLAGLEKAADTALFQTLLPPESLDEAKLVTLAGFDRLAELIYMEGDLPAPAEAATLDPALGQVMPYAPQAEAIFSRVIEQTYGQTRDCPGLEGLRRMEDILLGHRSSGVFVPELWSVYGPAEKPLGVVLLNEVLDPSAQAVELVYMGVTPEARGHGLARKMLRHAMARAVARGYRRIVLAVDAGNAPAIRLYTGFGMTEATRRIAFIMPLDDPARG